MFILIFFSPHTYGTTTTWQGANANWQTLSNWSSGVPGSSATDIAIFTNSGFLTLNNNGTTRTLNGFQFNASAFAFTINNTTAGGSILLSGSGIVNNSSNLQTITNSRTFTFSNSADAGSNVRITNTAGTLSFQDTSTANNATIEVNGGTLNISGLTGTSITVGSLSGTGGAINLGTKTLVAGPLNTDTTVRSTISGSGKLEKMGTGTLILTGTNTYSGGTIVTEGTLQVGNGSNIGSIAGDVINNAQLTFNRSNTLTYANVISGTGNLTKLGAGVLILSGDSPYTGSTTISAGTLRLTGAVSGTSSTNVGVGATLQIGNGGATGSLVGNIDNSGQVTFDRTGILTYSGSISGTGSLTKSGNGTLSLTGNNTYTGTTTILAGTLSIGDGGTSGSLLNSDINITGGTDILAFNRSDDYLFSNLISGAGDINKLGSGTLTLTGNNTYSGQTTIFAGTLLLTGQKTGAGSTTVLSGGTLQVGNGSDNGSVAGNIINNSAVIFNKDTALTYANVISGGGALTKMGAGTLTLSNNNTITGLITVSAGTLSIGNGGATGSIAGDLFNNAHVIFNRSNNLTYAHAISGAGVVTKQGGGILTLSAANSYTGSTFVEEGTLRLTGDKTGLGDTVISNGATVQIGNGGAVGSISGNILNEGQLTFSRTGTVIYAGSISGTGNLTKASRGTLVLSGINTYTGMTTFDAGTVSISQDANLGNAGSLTFSGGDLLTTSTFSINRLIQIDASGGTFITATDTMLTLEGQLTGSGQLRKEGAGVLILSSNTNNFTGGVLVLEGTLQGSTTTLPGDIKISSGAFVKFNQNTDGTYNGVISGGGNIIKDGTGTVTLTQIESYSGQTSIEQGALQGTTLSINDHNISISADTSLFLNQAFDGVYSGSLSGQGVLVKLGAGQVTLTGLNTYSGGTLINEGIVSISQDNQLGDETGRVTLHGGTLASTASFTMNHQITLGTNGGSIRTDSATELTQNSSITGAGQLTKSGEGLLVLNAINTYSGGTVLTEGTLKAGHAGAFVDNTNYVINGGTLDLNGFTLNMGQLSGTGGTISFNDSILNSSQETDSTFAGTLVGNQNSIFNKNGTGHLIFTGDSSTYQGQVNLNQGSLSIDGLMGGSFTIGTQSILIGTGSVNNLTVSGKIRPGHSIGTLTINGFYVQEQGSIYLTEINPNGASDLIHVNGRAEINGGTVQVLPEPGIYQFGTKYIILDASNGVSGQYESLSVSGLPYLYPELSYDNSRVYLTLYRNNVPFSDLARTQNQIATADAIETLTPSDPLYVYAANLTSSEKAQAAYDMLSGEIHATITGSMIKNASYLRNSIFDHLTDKQTQPYKLVWMDGYYNEMNRASNGNAAATRDVNRGLLFGLDADLLSHAQLGIIGGFGNNGTRVSARLSNAHLRYFNVGLYTEYRHKKEIFKCGFGQTWYQIKTNRQVELTGLSHHLNADYLSTSQQLFTELSYKTPSFFRGIDPVLQGSLIHINQVPFQESGGLTELMGAKKTYFTPISILGVRQHYPLLQQRTYQLITEGLVGWQHVYGQVAPLSSFAFNGSSNFLIQGAPIASNSAVLNAGIKLIHSRFHAFTLKMRYQGEFAGNLTGQGLIGELQYVA